MISGGIEVNQFAEIRLILEVKFGDNPLLKRCFILRQRFCDDYRGIEAP